MTEDVKTTATESSADTPSRSTNPKPPSKARAGVGVPKPPRAKAARKAAKPAGVAKPAPDDDDANDSPEFKKQELLAMVVERADVKKKFAKPVVEAMLAVLGEAFAEGRDMNLHPMGKVKHNRTKETAAAKIIITKIRQKKPRDEMSAIAKESIADTDEGR